MLRFVAVVPVVWLGCFSPADDSKPSSPTPAPAPTATAPQSGPTAEQILDKVAERQGSKKLPETIDDCRVETQVTVISEGKRLEADILHVYQRSANGDRLRTEYTDSQTKAKTIRVADGKKYRAAHGNEPAVDLEGRDFERDIEEVKQDLWQLKFILKLFALQSPSASGKVKWTRLADTDGNGLHSFVLERSEPDERTVRLYVSRDDFRVLGVELTPTDVDKRKQNFCFYETHPEKGYASILDSVTVAGKKVDGLRLPRLVWWYWDDAPKPMSDVWIKSVALNNGVSASVFTLP